MSQAPPAFLLRLREADVVRLCGLEAAAQGLELAARHAVSQPCRANTVLQAAVADEDKIECAVSVELPVDGALRLVRWECSRHVAQLPGDMATTPPGCAHVAALLVAWIRTPGEFAIPGGEPTEEPRDAVRARIPHPHLTQPPLLSASPAKHARDVASLAGELDRLPAAEAVEMARRVLGIHTDEHEARLRLAGTLRTPKQLSALLDRLDPGVAALLTDIELLGGSITAADLDALAARGERSSGALRTEIAVLERHGLVFRAAGGGAATSAEHSWRQFTGWRVPPEIRAAHAFRLPLTPLPTASAHGPPLLSTPPDVSVPHDSQVARIQRGSARPLCHALALLARAPRPYALHASPPASAEMSRPAAKHNTRQPFSLLAGELAPQALAELARISGIPAQVLRLARRLLFWAREHPDAHALLDLTSIPPGERALALAAGFRLWRTIESPSELADLDTPESPVRPRFDLSHEALRPASLAAEAASARNVVLRLLEHVEPEVWYALDDAVRLIWRIAPLFLRGRQTTYASPAWWLARRSDNRPLRPTERDEWLLGEGTYVRVLLASTLIAWGAVDLALDAADRPVAFRLTPLGRDLLAGTLAQASDSAMLARPDWGPAVLLTRDAMLAVQPLAAGSHVLETLERWARVTEIAGGRLIYTPDADRACAALDQGATPDALFTALCALPNALRAATAVRERLSAWQTRYGMSRIESGWALVEAGDEAILAEALAQVPEIAARSRPIGPTLALVPQADVPALREALARRGFTF